MQLSLCISLFMDIVILVLVLWWGSLQVLRQPPEVPDDLSLDHHNLCTFGGAFLFTFLTIWKKNHIKFTKTNAEKCLGNLQKKIFKCKQKTCTKNYKQNWIVGYAQIWNTEKKQIKLKYKSGLNFSSVHTKKFAHLLNCQIIILEILYLQ